MRKIPRFFGGVGLKTASKALALALLCGPIVFWVRPNDVAAQNEPEITAVVLSAALNVRSGPGVDYPVIGVMVADVSVAVVARDLDSGWFQVQFADGTLGWITGVDTYVRVEGEIAGLPEAVEPAVAMPATAPAVAGEIVFQPVTGGDIYIINADGSGLNRLTSGIDPSLSPDGSKVAFTRWDNDQNGALGSLWTVAVDGAGEQMVWNELAQPKSPAWAPDGDRLMVGLVQGGRLDYKDTCSSQYPTEPIVTKETPTEDDSVRVVVKVEPGGELDYKFCYTLLPHPWWGLGVVDVQVPGFRQVASDTFSYGPTWDPLNDWHVVFEGRLGLVNLDATRNVTWQLTEDPNDRAPVFSPDGTKIAVTYWQNDHYEIHTMNADGSGRQRLTETSLKVLAEQRLSGVTPGSYNNAAPAWSPDGSRIAFVSDRDGAWEFWVMDADGSAQQPLFPDGTLTGLTIQYRGVGERLISWR